MTAVCKRIFKYPFLVLAAALAFPAAAGELVRVPDREPDIDRVIYEMERVRSRIEDLEAVVDHIVVSQPEGREIVSRIALTYRRPDKLKTAVAGGREVLINGDRMWIYSPEIGVVETYLLKDEEQRRSTIYEMSWGLTSPIRVLLRGTNRSAAGTEGGNYLVTVTPDRADAEIERIQAWVDPRTWLIEKMTIVSRTGSPVELRIRDWKINSGLDDRWFEFRLPEGADLFDPLETGGEIMQ